MFHCEQSVNSELRPGTHILVLIAGNYSGSIFGLHQGMQGFKANWAIIILVPFLLLLGIKYRRNKYAVIVIAIAGGCAIIILISREGKSTMVYTEIVYYFHNFYPLD